MLRKLQWLDFRKGVHQSRYLAVPLIWLSSNVHATPVVKLPHPTRSLLSRARTQTPFPLENNNGHISFCTEWCQPPGPLPVVHCSTNLLNPFQHSSTRWMANRDARRSDSPPVAGWQCHSGERELLIGCDLSELFFFLVLLQLASIWLFGT